MAYFNTTQEKTFNRLRVLKELIAEHALHGEPCELLTIQLFEVEVLGEKFLEEIRAMREHLEDAT